MGVWWHYIIYKISTIMKSWETTLLGVLQFLVVLFTQVSYVIDADPLTVINYGVIISSAVAMIAFIKARDNNVSSEDAGAR